MVDRVYDQTEAESAAEQLDADLGFSDAVHRFNVSPSISSMGVLILKAVDDVLKKFGVDEVDEHAVKGILRTVESAVTGSLTSYMSHKF